MPPINTAGEQTEACAGEVVSGPQDYWLMQGFQWPPVAWPAAAQQPLQPQQHNQQKRRPDEDDYAPMKRARAAQPMLLAPQQPFGQVLQMTQQPPLHSIFAQPLRRPGEGMCEDAEIGEAFLPETQILVCDTRACPPCFAHRFCRPNQHCLVAEQQQQRDEAMQMDM